MCVKINSRLSGLDSDHSRRQASCQAVTTNHNSSFTCLSVWQSHIRGPIELLNAIKQAIGDRQKILHASHFRSLLFAYRDLHFTNWSTGVHHHVSKSIARQAARMLSISILVPLIALRSPSLSSIYFVKIFVGTATLVFLGSNNGFTTASSKPLAHSLQEKTWALLALLRGCGSSFPDWLATFH
jgi:hypothetical protein